MTNLTKVLGGALLSLMVGGVMPAQAATVVPIVNGSFEAGTTGRATGYRNGLTFGQLATTGAGWNTYAGVQGWTTASSSTRLEVHANRDPNTLDAQDGNYSVSLDGGTNSTIQQTVNLNAGTHILSFWYSPENANIATNRIGYSFGSLLSGTVSRGTNGATVGAWTLIQAQFIVRTAGAYVLSFAAMGPANSVGGLLDNVSLAAVPVPAAGLGMLAGLGALGGLKRRRRAA